MSNNCQPHDNATRNASIVAPTARQQYPLVAFVVKRLRKVGVFGVQDVLDLKQETSKYVVDSAVDEHLQCALSLIEDKLYPTLSTAQQALFQSIFAEYGATLKHPVLRPVENRPRWLLTPTPLTGFRSQKKLPLQADIVVIGAGLTGATAAYYLSKYAQLKHKRIVLLEAGMHPACQASGLNSGNFTIASQAQLRRSFGQLVEQRLHMLLQREQQQQDPKAKQDKHHETLQKLEKQDNMRDRAEYETEVLCQFAENNFERLQKLVQTEQLECDFSLEHNWLHIGETSDDDNNNSNHTNNNQTNNTTNNNTNSSGNISGNVNTTSSIDVDASDSTCLSPEDILAKFNLETGKHSARWLQSMASYHPYKLVTELVKRALTYGAELYTDVKAISINSPSQKEHKSNGQTLFPVCIETSEGNIECKRVVLATNAFTSDLLPDLNRTLSGVASHILTYPHLPNRSKALLLLDHTLVTEQHDDDDDHSSKIYYHTTGTNALHVGLDDPYVTETNQEVRLQPQAQQQEEQLQLQPLQLHPQHQDQAHCSEQRFREMLQTVNQRFPETIPQPPTALITGVMAMTPDRAPLIGFWRRPDTNIVVAAGFQGFGGSSCIQAGHVAAWMARTGKVHPDVPELIFSPSRFLPKN